MNPHAKPWTLVTQGGGMGVGEQVGLCDRHGAEVLWFSASRGRPRLLSDPTVGHSLQGQLPAAVQVQHAAQEVLEHINANTVCTPMYTVYIV